MSPWLTKGFLAIAAASSLTACRGGDETNSLRAGDSFGSGDPNFFQPGTPTTPTPSASAAGLWFGTVTPDANPTNPQPMVALVTEEGDFVALSRYGGVDGFLFVGQNTGAGDDFNGDATTYDGLTYAGDGTLTGTAVAGTSLNGSFVVDMTSAEFQLQFSSLYQRSASLEKLQGVYTYEGFDGQHSIVVDSSGNLTGQDFEGCTLNGSVTAPHPDRNYYRFSGELGACDMYSGPMRALIYLDDDDLGGTDNVIVLLGETNSQDTAVIVNAVR